MAVIAFVSTKSSPGATTSAVALAITWSTPALLVGADPSGDEVLSGYLAPWVSRGFVRPNTGLVSFTHATRHAEPTYVADLAPHTKVLPGSANSRVLVGVTEPAQAGVVGAAGFQRLAAAVKAAAGLSNACDALLDCGRFGSATPRPLLEAADLVVLAVRARHRSVMAARPVLRVLRQMIQPERLGLAVIAASPKAVDEVVEVLSVPVAVALPLDLVAAAAFSDAEAAVPRRSPLVKAAAAAGRRLHQALAQPPAQRALVGARS
jgi:hypothetical protein